MFKFLRNPIENICNAAWFVRAFARARWGYRFKSRAVLLNHQHVRLRKHRLEWWSRSPFYQPYIHTPHAVPMMNKARMMAHFDALNTVGLTAKACYEWAANAERSRDFSKTLRGVSVGMSSGTSAVRGIFLASPSEKARWAGHILAALLPWPFFKRQRVALFLRANSGLYESLGKSRWIQFAFFDLSRPFEVLAQELHAFSPSILVAPSQCLSMLTDAQTRWPIAPQKVISVAETLPDDVRAKVRDAWHVRVDEIYQATEGFLATTCWAGRLHLNETLVHFEFEVLNAELRRVVPIISDFSRTSQIMMRYRLDDVLILSKDTHCQCGQHTQLIDKIEGRCDDVIRLPSIDNGLATVFPDFIARGLLFIEGIEDFLVVQTNPHTLHVTFVGAQISNTHIKQALTQVWRLCGVDGKQVVLEINQSRLIAHNLMYKRRRVIGLNSDLNSETFAQPLKQTE